MTSRRLDAPLWARSPVLDRALRWTAARWWGASGQAARNRARYYGGATGVRLFCFHDTQPAVLEELKRLADWCRERLDVGSPSDVDALVSGRWAGAPRDRMVFTFDDGFETNHRAAELLHREGLSAFFFLVPSLVGRTVAEHGRFHERHGVKAFGFGGRNDARGLCASQVREMVAMGHRIGAHNFAHRDLGQLHDPESLRYEITNALDAIGELTGTECQDFAVGFGLPCNLSPEATAYLLARTPRVFLAHRGLNVPGRTPRFLLRHAVVSTHPFAFTSACATGSGDHLLADYAFEMARRVGHLPGAPGRDP